MALRWRGPRGEQLNRKVGRAEGSVRHCCDSPLEWPSQDDKSGVTLNLPT